MFLKFVHSIIPIFITLILLPTSTLAAVSIEDITNPRGASSVNLSPDGKHIALIGFSGTTHALIIIDVVSMKAKSIIQGRRVVEANWAFNKDPQEVTWITNDLLAVDYGIQIETVTLDGKKVEEIVSSLEGAKVIGKADFSQPDSPLFLLATNLADNDIAIANGRTGKLTKLRFPMSGKPIHWAFDKNGQLRALTLLDSAFWKDANSVTNWYKPSVEAAWEKMEEFKVTDDYWIPMFVPEQENSLVISSNSGRDTRAVFRYDTKNHTIAELMAGHPTQDILTVDGIQQREFNSVLTNGMRPEKFWFDSDWSKIQTSVDAVLPERVNILSGDPKNQVLIFSYGDVDPGTWLVLDTIKLTMTDVAKAKTSIDATKMRPMSTITYKASDGLIIPGYLTRPAVVSGCDDSTRCPAPMIVLVHGGPTVRDLWKWNDDVQILASNGYVVFQPQFRGSHGFGKKFKEAGFGQWGLAMQDDITTGVEYLIQQGIADPKRICIYGASYGGYAALWGLIKTPDLYKCGVSFAGVADIEYMFNDSSDTNANSIGRELMRSRVGDVKQKIDQFDRVSPLKHADQIMVPVLLMHGDEDKRVPISHGEKMKAALEKNNKIYQWTVFEGEGHGLRYVASQNKYFKTLLEFFAKYLDKHKEILASTPQRASVAEQGEPKNQN
jgi:dipeptidyl aminopeptidase/acylaminoacyl peptidase